MVKKLLLTFDYELFLGSQSGSVDNCLIFPTNMLLDVMERHGAKAIFFVDTVYMMRMVELKGSYVKVAQDFEKIKKQLKDILEKGHKLYHHIHPHWIDAQYDETDNQWNLSDDTHYCVESLSEEKKKQIFDFSVSFLSEIMDEAGFEYNCCGYRAGGLYIEPFNTVRCEFDRCGICDDYSSEASIEKKIEVYNFEESTLCSDVNGRYAEYPISRIRIYGLRKILNGIYYRLAKRNAKCQKIGDGTPSKPQKGDVHAKTSRLEFSLPISIELLTPVLLPYYKKMIRRYSYVHFLSHPKLQSRETISLFEKLLKYFNG